MSCWIRLNILIMNLKLCTEALWPSQVSKALQTDESPITYRPSCVWDPVPFSNSKSPQHTNTTGEIKNDTGIFSREAWSEPSTPEPRGTWLDGDPLRPIHSIAYLWLVAWWSYRVLLQTFSMSQRHICCSSVVTWDNICLTTFKHRGVHRTRRRWRIFIVAYPINFWFDMVTRTKPKPTNTQLTRSTHSITTSIKTRKFRSVASRPVKIFRIFVNHIGEMW